MNLTDKLTALMQRHGYNKRTLSQSCGVPYTTIVGLYTKGYEGARLSTLKSLADFFDVTIDYLGRDEITDPSHGKSPPELTSDEQQLISDYRSLNEQGQEYIRQTMAMAKPMYYKGSSDLSNMEDQA